MNNIEIVDENGQTILLEEADFNPDYEPS